VVRIQTEQLYRNITMDIHIHIPLQIKPHNFKMRLEQQTLFNMPCNKILHTKIISATTLRKFSILQ